MYNVLQLSLKEYKVKNNSSDYDIDILLYEFKNGEYISLTSNGLSSVEVITLEPQGEHIITLPRDGIYKLELRPDSEFQTQNLANIVIHNITDLLEKKQKFLTDVLLRPHPSKCDHNQYYDLISFNIIFDSYSKLVKDTFTEANIPQEQLYKIEYLLNRLKTF